MCTSGCQQNPSRAHRPVPKRTRCGRCPLSSSRTPLHTGAAPGRPAGVQQRHAPLKSAGPAPAPAQGRAPAGGAVPARPLSFPALPFPWTRSLPRRTDRRLARTRVIAASKPSRALQPDGLALCLQALLKLFLRIVHGVRFDGVLTCAPRARLCIAQQGTDEFIQDGIPGVDPQALGRRDQCLLARAGLRLV